MHGLGNDFVVLDALAPEGGAIARRDDFASLARAMCDRRLGVGADQLLLLDAPTEAASRAGAAFRMRVWNADGSASEMCGNGIRCVVRLTIERGRVQAREAAVIVETGAGLLPCRPRCGAGGRVESVTVEMGEPTFGPEATRAAPGRLRPGSREHEWRVGEVEGALVSVGNPHLVVFLGASVAAVDLASLGPRLERDAAFPQRINVQIVNAIEPSLAVVRTWERGAGLTSACGTGACAVIAAGVLTGRLAREATIRLPGGDLSLSWDERSNRLLMTGPATLVYEGVWPE